MTMPHKDLFRNWNSPMKTKPLFFCIVLSSSLVNSNSQTSPSSSSILNPNAPASSSGPAYTVADRGPVHRLWQRTVTLTNYLTGKISQEVHQYTELGDGLCYQENGQWIDSQDLIEITPTGAEAVHGPIKARFSPNLNTVGAISLTTPSGQVFQSHPLGLYYFDAASGKAAVISTSKDTMGQLAPPNQVVYTNAFTGLTADMMYVYAKEGFEQNVVLLQAPPPPDHYGLAPATTRLEVWTAFDNSPALKSQRPVVLKQETDSRFRPSMVEPDLIDRLLFFGDSWFPVGTAFIMDDSRMPPPNQPARVRLTSPSDTNHVPVAKNMVTINNQTILIESVNYVDLLPKLKTLQQAALPGDRSEKKQQVAQGRKLPPLLCAQREEKPMQLASALYAPRGVVLDYTQLSGSMNSYTFLNGSTYVISNSFSVGPGTATVQNNLAVKYATNAYLLLFGPVSFPSTGFPDFFTSADDNLYGETLPGSTSMPNYAAAQAIWMYFHTVATTVNDVRVRWAQRGIEYDENPGVFVAPALSSSAFMNCNIGVYVNVADDTLTLSQDTQCETLTPIYPQSGNYTGTITTDCGVVSRAWVNDPYQDRTSGDPNGDPNKNSQSECSFVLGNNNRIVAAHFNTHLSKYGLGAVPFSGNTDTRSIWWTVSTGGGASFDTNNRALPPSSPFSPSQGDAGDPVMARDTLNNVIYLLGNPSRESGYQGFRLWKSTDSGQTFGTSIFNTNVPGNFSYADRPMIAVNNFPNLPTSTNIYVAGQRIGGTTGVFAARSSDGGVTWTDSTTFGANTQIADIAIRTDGTVYVFCMNYTYNNPDYVNWIEYKWLPPSGSWQGPKSFGAHANRTNLYLNTYSADAKLLRRKGADSNDYFLSYTSPRVAVNPVNNRIYLVYADWPSATPSDDRGDIFVQEASGSDGSLTWSGEKTVNNDRTVTDQWNPSVAVSPDGNWVFVGYYSRQSDPNNNAWIKGYGAKAYVPNGLAGSTFDTFPIDSVSFTNLFPGSTTSTPSTSPWLFDNVWCQTGVCLDASARVTTDTTCCDAFPPTCVKTGNTYQNFCADDYTWVSADSSYFYFAWRDCSLPCTNRWGVTDYIRADPNIRFGKIKQFNQ